MGRVLAAGLLATAVASAAARSAEIGAIVAGASAEGRVQDDALYGGGADVVGVISPEIGYHLDGPRLDASLRGDADLYRYQGVAPQNNANYRSYLDLKWNASRAVEVTAAGTLQWITDPLSLDRLGVPRTTSPVLFGAATVEGDDRFAEHWTARLGYQYQIAHFLDPALVDGTVHQPWMEAARQFGPEDEVALRWRSQFFLRIETPNGSSQTPSLGWKHRFSHTLRLELDAGPMYYIPPAGSGDWTPYAIGGLVLTLAHGEIELRGGRDLVGATGFGVALWADYVEAGWIGHISRRWSGRLGGTYFVNGLAPAQPAALSGYGAEGAIDYQLARDWQLEFVADRIGQTGAPETSPLSLSLDVAAFRASYHWGSDARLR